MQLGRHFLLIIMANIRGIPLTNRVPTSLPGTWGIKLFSYKKPWKHSDTRPTYPQVGNSERSAKSLFASYGSCIACAVISSGSKGKVFANEEVKM